METKAWGSQSAPDGDYVPIQRLRDAEQQVAELEEENANYKGAMRESIRIGGELEAKIAELEAKLADAESLIDYAEIGIDEAVEDGWVPPSCKLGKEE